MEKDNSNPFISLFLLMLFHLKMSHMLSSRENSPSSSFYENVSNFRFLQRFGKVEKWFSLVIPAWNLTAVTCSITSSQKWESRWREISVKSRNMCWCLCRSLLSTELLVRAAAVQGPGAQFSISESQRGTKPALGTGLARAGQGESTCNEQGLSSAAGKPWSERPSNFGKFVCLDPWNKAVHSLPTGYFPHTTSLMPYSLI